MNFVKIWAIIVASNLFLSGCASLAPATVETMSDEVSARTISMPVPSDKAAVFIYRNPSFFGQAALYSVAVDGRVVGWNASGTYLRLILAPGYYEFHTFNFYQGGRNPKATDHALRLRVESGKSYYMSHYSQMRANTAGPVFEQVSVDEGRSRIEGLKLARFDTRYLPISDFPMARGSEDNRASPTPLSSASVTPSDDNLSKFLEGLALVLLIGLAVYGAAHSGSTVIPDIDSYKPVERRPAVAVQQVRKAPEPDIRKSFLTTSGDIYEFSGNRIYSPTRGEEWRVNGNQIQGTNGQIFKVSGDAIYADNGQSYRAVGNNLFGSDGSICAVNGNLIDCSR